MLINGWHCSIDFPFTTTSAWCIKFKKSLLIEHRAEDLIGGAIALFEESENPATIAIGSTTKSSELSVNFWLL